MARILGIDPAIGVERCYVASVKVTRRIAEGLVGKRTLRKLWWVRRQLGCRHTHTFQFRLDRAWWCSHGSVKGPHGGLMLEGCYLCGKVWVRDTMGPNGPDRDGI